MIAPGKRYLDRDRRQGGRVLVAGSRTRGTLYPQRECADSITGRITWVAEQRLTDRKLYTPLSPDAPLPGGLSTLRTTALAACQAWEALAIADKRLHRAIELDFTPAKVTPLREALQTARAAHAAAMKALSERQEINDA